MMIADKKIIDSKIYAISSNGQIQYCSSTPSSDLMKYMQKLFEFDGVCRFLALGWGRRVIEEFLCLLSFY